MVRIGIIGCGRIVEQGHSPAFLQLKDRVDVVAIADPSLERRKIVGDMLDVKDRSRYADYKELLEKEDVQIVDLALPHFLHEKITIGCARAKVDIISEKPLAPTLEMADKILEAVEENSVRLGVLHNHLYRPLFSVALRLIGDGAIGQPFLLRNEQLVGGYYQGAKQYDSAWRTNAARSGAGCLLDNGYHNIYLAGALLNSPPVQVFARVETYLYDINVEDTSVVTMAHKNGSTSHIQNSWTVKAPTPWVLGVHGTEGSIVFDAHNKRLGLYRHSAGEWEYPEVKNDGGPASFLGIFKHFLDAYDKGNEFPIGGREARQNLEILTAAYCSAKEGQAVNLV